MAGKREGNLAVLLGQAIMKRRQRLGMTQLEFAEKLGVEQHSVSRMEKGIISPKMARLRDVADILDCTVADLFRQTDAPAYAKAREICHMIEELSPDMQNIVVELVEQTSAALKRLEAKHGV